MQGVWILIPALPPSAWVTSSRQSTLSVRGGAELDNLPISLRALTFYNDKLWAQGSGDRSSRKTHLTAEDESALLSVTQLSQSGPSLWGMKTQQGQSTAAWSRQDVQAGHAGTRPHKHAQAQMHMTHACIHALSAPTHIKVHTHKYACAPVHTCTNIHAQTHPSQAPYTVHHGVLWACSLLCPKSPATISWDL